MIFNLTQWSEGGSSAFCILTVKNCGAGATVTAIGPATVSAMADYQGIAYLTLTQQGAYTISSTIIKGTKTFLFTTQTEAEIWLHRLPSEYQEVEYIQTSGTQCINTDIVPNLDWSVDIEYRRLSTSTSTGSLWCARGANVTDNTFSTHLVNGTALRFDYYKTNTGATYSVNDLLKHSAYRNKNNVYIDSNLKRVDELHTESCIGPLKFFASYTNGINNNVSNFAKIQCYRIRIWNSSDVLVSEFIPCYRKSDNVAGMYDMVTDTFYINNGTGAFEIGHYVLMPDEIQIVEYLQSTGTQMIITQIIPTQDTMVELKSTFTDFNNLGVLFGSTNGGSSRFYPYSMASSSSQVRSDYGSGEYISSVPLNTWSEIVFNDASHNLYLNGELKNTMSGFTNTTRPMYLFCANYNGTKDYYCRAKLEYCRVYEGYVLIADFVPCYTKLDNQLQKIAGLYDRVSKLFYQNDGTGTFIVGEDAA